MAPDSKSPYRLLVEGKDDKLAIINLLKRHGFDWDASEPTRPFVHEAGGVEKLFETLPVALKTYRRIGIVVDADWDMSTRWSRLKGIMSHLDIPEAPAPEGTVITCSSLATLERVGVWLMPNNHSSGNLEDFLALLVPSENRCWMHAKAATRDAREVHGAPLQEKDIAKGEIHAWLAWQKEPGHALGTAITACTLNSECAAAHAFVKWFRRIFE